MEEVGGLRVRVGERAGVSLLSGQESDERSQSRGLRGVGALAGTRLTECHRGRGCW